MAGTSRGSQADDDHVLAARMDDARVMATLLKTVSFKDVALVRTHAGEAKDQ